VTTHTLTASLVAPDLMAALRKDIRMAKDVKTRAAAFRRFRRAERDAQIAEGLAEWAANNTEAMA